MARSWSWTRYVSQSNCCHQRTTWRRKRHVRAFERRLKMWKSTKVCLPPARILLPNIVPRQYRMIISLIKISRTVYGKIDRHWARRAILSSKTYHIHPNHPLPLWLRPLFAVCAAVRHLSHPGPVVRLFPSSITHLVNFQEIIMDLRRISSR